MVTGTLRDKISGRRKIRKAERKEDLEFRWIDGPNANTMNARSISRGLLGTLKGISKII